MSNSNEAKKIPSLYSTKEAQAAEAIVTQVLGESPEQELARLRAENATLKKAVANDKSSFKITEKGGLSVYGLGRFPVTLYKSQWLKLIAMVEQIKVFIAANDHLMTDKAKEVPTAKIA